MVIADHFPDIRKMVKIGSGAEKVIDDILLTRYACYLIAQNGDSRKEEIAFAQNYFAVQTRRAEIIEQRMLNTERLQARAKLAETEKILSECALTITIISIFATNHISTNLIKSSTHEKEHFNRALTFSVSRSLSSTYGRHKRNQLEC
jgi:hypothetical protein